MRQHIPDHHNRSTRIGAVHVLLVAEVLVGTQVLCVIFLAFGFDLNATALGAVVVTVVAMQALVLVQVLKRHGEAAGTLNRTQCAVLS